MIRVEDVMTTAVEFIAADSPAKDAAALMGELDVGALPVGSEKKIEGVITDRDILYRIVARGLDPSTVRVRDVWSQPVIACRDTDTLQAAMDIMAANHIRRLAVEDEGGRAVGWLTIGDVSRKLLVEDATLQKSLSLMTGETEAQPAA